MKTLLKSGAALVLVGLAVGSPSPAGAQTAAATVIEVPLRVSEGRLVVPVESAEGEQSWFAVATGSGRTTISESAANLLGQEPRLTLGGLTVPTEDMGVLPDSRFTVDGVTLDGMIGTNLLSDYDVLIDVPGERLLLKSLGRQVEWEGVALSEPVSLRIMHGVALMLDVELEGTSYPAIIDLSTAPMIVSEGVKSDLGLSDEDARPLAVGGTDLGEVPIHVRQLEVFDMWAPNGEGVVVLGAAMAHGCAIALSWVHAEIRTCLP